jgi:predicted nucleic acid-binding protein
MKLKVYIETTIISYYASKPSNNLIIKGHQQVTREWWDKQLDKYKPYISEVILEEISRGDAVASKKRLKIVEDFSLLGVNDGVLALARNYFLALDLPDKARLDAVHLALGVYHGMDFIISWNFAHISGARPRSIIENINYQIGIKTPTICTPEELMEG